jgi:hypothetical protein
VHVLRATGSKLVRHSHVHGHVRRRAELRILRLRLGHAHAGSLHDNRLGRIAGVEQRPLHNLRWGGEALVQLLRKNEQTTFMALRSIRWRFVIRVFVPVWIVRSPATFVITRLIFLIYRKKVKLLFPISFSLFLLFTRGFAPCSI